jgi:hypothetical protein
VEKSLAVLKVENWGDWTTAVHKAKVHIATSTSAPAVLKAPMIAFLYFGSLQIFSSIIAPRGDYILLQVVLSFCVAAIAYIYYREKEKKELSIAEEFFEEIMVEKRKLPKPNWIRQEL